ncbi:MAG: hypothetical protein ABSA83_08310 [Verrucomicrobiota bacterium]|jgi:hypothetical protein
MKDFDLESKVKALRVPEREEDYWQTFPDRVMKELRRAPERPARRVFMPGLMWCARLALACAMLGFCLWQSRMPATLSHALRKDEQELRQSVERIHDNLGRLMQDEHGLDKLVEDQP